MFLRATAIATFLAVVCAYAQTGKPEPPRQSIVLVLEPLGFQSDGFDLPAAETQVTIINRTGSPRLTLNLGREDAPSPAVENLDVTRKTFRGSVALTPGNFVISVVGNPKWVCRLRVGAAK